MTQEIALADFLDQWGEVLKSQVIRNMNPVYRPKAEDDWDREARNRLGKLLRPPFDAQIRRGILPVARTLYREDRKGAFLVGEMGTGKTIMSLAIAALDPKPAKRILVQCPGHLVRKWRREAEVTIPACTCYNLNDQDMDLLLANKHKVSRPLGTEIWVIGKERAKLHYQRRIGTITRLGAECCPDCGKPVEYRASDLAPACEHCQARMWSADPERNRRFAKAEFIKRYLPKGFFDLVILDEVHELKGGGTAQGQAMSCLIARSRKVLALTGTLMGGYSKDLFFLLWRMFPGQMAEAGFEYGRTLGFAERYGVVQRTYSEGDCELDLNQASIGRKSGRARVKEAPGISPLLLPDLLLERSAFVRLNDVSEILPDYDEIIVSVPMGDEQQEQYQLLAIDLTEATRKALERGGIEEVVASAPALALDLLPKEERLLEILAAEKKEGRKAAIFVEHTGTRDLLPTLEDKLRAKCFTPLVLRGHAVRPEKREDWLRENLATGRYDCLLCNPNLVKTGLDLLDFPTIIFFQCGYSVFTLRQASRRSWRIGQQQSVRVFFMAYAETMQEKALSLMAQKMETSLAVEGELSDQGLAALSESENSMVYELAKALTGRTTVGDVNQAWDRYRRRELAAVLALDDEQGVASEEETTITTTTTLTTADGRTSQIRHELIIRGRVYIRRDSAVAYVAGNKFELRSGVVLWNGRKIGSYDRQGCGEINCKPIRIYRPQNTDHFVLAEVRSAA
ncbi:MAG: SNF2-related protein [Desulfobulbaceae bacterium]